MTKKIQIRDIILSGLLAYVLICRSDRNMADWYATRLYPVLSGMLSRVSSIVPFSLDEILVVVLCLALILILVRGIRKRERWYYVIWKEVRWLILIYVWFYLGWGLNYSRSSLSRRMDTPIASYDEQAFKEFLTDYVEQLNSSYDSADSKDLAYISGDIRNFYSGLPSRAGLCRPRTWQAPKYALASGFFSKVGVTGSMGPFLAESLLNSELPGNGLPFTAAHEFAHLMGVSSEAEANFWAFRYCQISADASVRYSGYISLLGNILRNARGLLPEGDYVAFVNSIRDEVKDDFNSNQDYWAARYSKLLGRIQNTLYNAYLKGNGISSGTRNYDEVVSLLMTDFPIDIKFKFRM